jgi:hypothetical protein
VALIIGISVLRKRNDKYVNIISRWIGATPLRELAIASILNIPLIILSLYIYILSADHIVTRLPIDAAFYSPNLSEMVQIPPSNYLDGGFINKLFNNALPAQGEAFMGFSLIFLVPLVIIVFKNLISAIKHGFVTSTEERSLQIASILFIVIEFLVLRDSRGFSFWYLSGARIPIFSSLRAISRINTFQYMLGGFILGMYLHLKLRDRFRLIHRTFTLEVFALLIGAMFLTISEGNSYFGSWNESNMQGVLLEDLRSLDGCESFVVRPDGIQSAEPNWERQVDDQTLALRAHIPTLTGYSGDQPRNYSIDTTNTGVFDLSVQNFQDVNKLNNLCVLATPKGVLPKQIYTFSSYLELLKSGGLST